MFLGLKNPLSKEKIEQIEAENKKMIDDHILLLRTRSQTSLSKRDFESKTWDKLEVNSQELSDCAKVVKSWSPDLGAGLFLHGDPGNGKTHLLKALIIDNYSTTLDFRFVRCSDLMASFKDYQNLEFYHQEYLKPWGLIIDDFGTEKGSDFEQEQLFRLLEQRKDKDKFVFMTSNLNLKQIGEKYNKRILSRIGEHMIVVENKAPSYRKIIQMRMQEKLQNQRLNLLK